MIIISTHLVEATKCALICSCSEVHSGSTTLENMLPKIMYLCGGGWRVGLPVLEQLSKSACDWHAFKCFIWVEIENVSHLRYGSHVFPIDHKLYSNKYKSIKMCAHFLMGHSTLWKICLVLCTYIAYVELGYRETDSFKSNPTSGG